MKRYAGIGSRKTPVKVREWMEKIAEELAKAGWTLRSGAAEGADQAFERGCDRAGGRKEIDLPWPGFQDREPDGRSVFVRHGRTAQRIAQLHYTRWPSASQAVRKLMARNTCQVLGDVDGAGEVPVDVVIGWTLGGRGGGGTGQAYRVAEGRNIPRVDLALGVGAAKEIPWLQEVLRKTWNGGIPTPARVAGWRR